MPVPISQAGLTAISSQHTATHAHFHAQTELTSIPTLMGRAHMPPPEAPRRKNDLQRSQMLAILYAISVVLEISGELRRKNKWCQKRTRKCSANAQKTAVFWWHLPNDTLIDTLGLFIRVVRVLKAPDRPHCIADSRLGRAIDPLRKWPSR